jgi:hypothetical protein
MRRWLLGISIAAVVAGCAFIVSYAVLNHFYGTTRTETLTREEYEKIRPVMVPAVQEAYEAAEEAGEPLIIYETKSIAVLPIAASIGIGIGIIILAVWTGYRRIWGDATSILLERGLQDMTVRDVEIVGHIMELEEFTIPELMRRTHASKITVWRTVQKLVEKGLVRPTEKTALTANGLGGRGKPSRIYKYVGGKGV